MGYTVEPSQNGKYIVCRVSGEITAEIARDFSRELDKLGRALDVKRFLNDVREASNAMGIFRNYEYAYKDMSELGLRKDVRSAILTSPEDRSHDFVETVARNAGYDVRIFHDEGAAIAWLTE